MKIEVNNIYKSYHSKHRDIDVLKDVTFSLEKGKFYCLKGDSGCGKTTLLSILAGVIKPDKGQVIVDDTNLTALSEDNRTKLRRHTIAYIPQAQEVIEDLTVEENITLVDYFEGKKINQEKLEEVVNILGINKLRKEYPRELSGGEARRVIFARALYQGASVIYADEPTNDLDKDNREAIASIIKSITEKGVTFMAATHDEGLMCRANKVFALQ